MLWWDRIPICPHLQIKTPLFHYSLLSSFRIKPKPHHNSQPTHIVSRITCANSAVPVHLQILPPALPSELANQSSNSMPARLDSVPLQVHTCKALLYLFSLLRSVNSDYSSQSARVFHINPKSTFIFGAAAVKLQCMIRTLFRLSGMKPILNWKSANTRYCYIYYDSPL